jgi:hypothetical protein
LNTLFDHILRISVFFIMFSREMHLSRANTDMINGLTGSFHGFEI